MAKFIFPALEAFVADDISQSDVCYSLTAHLLSAVPGEHARGLDGTLLQYVQDVVASVATGERSVESAAHILVVLREKLSDGGGLAPNGAIDASLFTENR